MLTFLLLASQTIPCSGVGLNLPPSCSLSELTSRYPSSFVQCSGRLPVGGCLTAPGIRDSFHFVQLLGKGAFGKVAAVEPLVHDMGSKRLKGVEGRGLVVKEIRPAHRESKQGAAGRSLEEWKSLAVKEAVVGFKLSSLSDHFVRHFAAFMYDDGMCLLMEKVEGGDLMRALDSSAALNARDVDGESGRLPEHLVREITLQVLQGLRQSHAVGIELGDVKMHNLMLDRPLESFLRSGGKVKISDYGLARVAGPIDDIDRYDESWTHRGQEGTVGFLPPHVGGGTLLPPSPAFRRKFHQDVYALGVTVLKLLLGLEVGPAFQRLTIGKGGDAKGKGKGKGKGGLNGKFIFDGVQVAKRLSTSEFAFPSFLVSEECESFLAAALTLETFSSASSLLQHPWFALSGEALKQAKAARVLLFSNPVSFANDKKLVEKVEKVRSDWAPLKERVRIYERTLSPPLVAFPLKEMSEWKERMGGAVSELLGLHVASETLDGAGSVTVSVEPLRRTVAKGKGKGKGKGRGDGMRKGGNRGPLHRSPSPSGPTLTRQSSAILFRRSSSPSTSPQQRFSFLSDIESTLLSARRAFF